jgi:hypothetical protein
MAAQRECSANGERVDVHVPRLVLVWHCAGRRRLAHIIEAPPRPEFDIDMQPLSPPQAGLLR